VDNYFDFYKIEEKFFIDEKKLRTAYLEFSKLNHPDLFMNDEDKYNKALDSTSLNNRSYKQLKSFKKRMSYILTLNGVLDESKNAIPQSFLMEMMDVNETIMDLKMDHDAEKLLKLIKDIEELDGDFDLRISNLAKDADALKGDERQLKLERIKDIYLKQKYVLRLKESLDTFAPL
jgi:molecular chaperone HscB